VSNHPVESPAQLALSLLARAQGSVAHPLKWGVSSPRISDILAVKEKIKLRRTHACLTQLLLL
jgi:hypothetical protein